MRGKIDNKGEKERRRLWGRHLQVVDPNPTLGILIDFGTSHDL